MSFTGFPSRGGHFGIRRLNVSFGLGPQGFTGSPAVGTPTTKGGVVVTYPAESDVLAFVAQGDVETPNAVLTPAGFVLLGDIAAYLAHASPEHPMAVADVGRPQVAPDDPCDPNDRGPRAKGGEMRPSAKAAEASPTARAASQPGGVRASSTGRKPGAKSTVVGPRTRRKK